MPSTTANDPEMDDLLLDAIEQQVMHHDVSVTMQRCWVNASRPSSWQVTFKVDAARNDGKGKKFASGGGVTLREALQSAFALLAEERLAR